MAKLNREEFVVKAITTLRQGNQKGLPTGAAGLQEAFRSYYGEKADLVKTCERMANGGRLVMRPNKQGHMLYLPDEAPAIKRTASDVLKAMEIKTKRAVTQAS